MLGLSVNTRMIGMAVMKENTLENYYISLRKEAWTYTKKERILTIIKDWLTTHRISQVALATPYESRSTPQIKELLESIRTLIKDEGILIRSYEHDAIYLYCDANHRKTKSNAMRELSVIYPELSRYYEKEIRNKNRYYVKLFEAVAIVTTHLKKSNILEDRT